MATKIDTTWAGFRTVYGINGYDYSIGDGNLVFNTGGVGIHPASPCSVLFRTTQFAKLIFQNQPWFAIDESTLQFALNASAVYGGLIPDKEWAYFKTQTVSTFDGSFAIQDDAQFAFGGQATGSFPPIVSISGFTNF